MFTTDSKGEIRALRRVLADQNDEITVLKISAQKGIPLIYDCGGIVLSKSGRGFDVRIFGDDNKYWGRCFSMEDALQIRNWLTANLLPEESR